jgi:hypothetical protein
MLIKRLHYRILTNAKFESLRYWDWTAWSISVWRLFSVASLVSLLADVRNRFLSLSKNASRINRFRSLPKIRHLKRRMLIFNFLPWIINLFIFFMINYIVMFFDNILLEILRLEVFLKSKREASKWMSMPLWGFCSICSNRLPRRVFIILLILFVFKTCRLLLVVISYNNNVFRKLIILLSNVAGIITLLEIFSNNIRLRIWRQLSF